jgi:hypothetical protein
MVRTFYVSVQASSDGPRSARQKLALSCSHLFYHVVTLASILSGVKSFVLVLT